MVCKKAPLHPTNTLELGPRTSEEFVAVMGWHGVEYGWGDAGLGLDTRNTETKVKQTKKPYLPGAYILEGV